MQTYMLKRLFLLLPVLLGISLVVFFVIHLIPGDPVTVMLGEKASPEVAEKWREELGLNDPLYVQYSKFLGRAVQGDLGKSIRNGEMVSKLLVQRLPATLELTFISMLIAVTIGVFLGVVAAVRQYSIWDNFSMVLAIAGVSMPVFWLGLMLIIVFTINLGWLPATGRLTVGLDISRISGLHLVDSLLTMNFKGFHDALRHLIMPAIALSAVQLAIIARLTRSSMLEVIRMDYIRTARAKGLSERVVIYKHAIRNALIPVITIIGLTLGRLLGGAVLTETVFAWPGIGKMAVDAIYARDFPLVQGIVLIVATGFVIVNLLVDYCYAMIDPRIRYD